MPHLIPFPRFFRLPARHTETLPITRNGIRNMSPFPFVEEPGPVLPVLTVREHASGAFTRGICGLLPASTFTAGIVRPHENTLVTRLERQRRLVREDGGALGKPILLTVPTLQALWQRLPLPPPGEGLTYRGPENTYHLASGPTHISAIDLEEYGPLVGGRRPSPGIYPRLAGGGGAPGLSAHSGGDRGGPMN